MKRLCVKIPFPRCATISSSGLLEGVEAKLKAPNLDTLPEKIQWTRLPADGVTPRNGVVMAVREYGAVIAISQTQKGLVPASTNSSEAAAFLELARGAPVTVYITSKCFDTQKFNLALTPREELLKRLDRMIIDGRHPYHGVVSSIADFGYFIDIGFERKGFLPLREVPEGTEIQLGDKLTVYATSHNWRAGRFSVSLKQLETPNKPKQLLQVDGQTPYKGTVQAVVDGVAVIDFGFDTRGMMQTEDDDVVVGTVLTVYAVRRMRRSRRVFLSRRPTLRPLLMMKDVIADGQTPYMAKIAGQVSPGFGVHVDIGCEEYALLPEREIIESPSIVESNPLQVYIQQKTPFNGLLVASTHRRSVPRERLSALRADGWTPYEGVVLRRHDWGTLVDIGCEVPGLLLPNEELPKVSMTPRGPTAALLLPVPEAEERLRIGAKITVYVWTKSCLTGRVCLGLEARPKPGISLHSVPIDGVTPLLGTVTRISEVGAFVDLGCELLGRISQNQEGNERARQLSQGDVIEVYARRRNVESGRISLGLVPDPKRRLSIEEVSEGGREHEGIVVSVQHGTAFLDFYCEVSGICEAVDLMEGDHVLVKVDFLDDRERFQVSLVKILNRANQMESTYDSQAAAPSLDAESSEPTGKGELQHLVQRRLGRPLRKNEILYKAESEASGLWRASVEFPWGGDLIKCWDDVGAKKKIAAEHAAAINALQQIRNLSNKSE